MSIVTKLAGATALGLILAGPVLAQGTTTETAPAAAAATPAAKTRTDVTADTVVATVNGKDITLGEMVALRDSLPPQYQSLPDDVLFNGLLDQLIQQTALAQLGEKSVTKKDQLVMDTQRTSYLAGIVLDQTSQAAVTDEAIKAAYDAKYANAKPSEEYNASHILVKTKEEAEQVKKDLDGGKDFLEEAKEKSTGPSGPNGGDLGWFGKGMMVEPFEQAVEKMKKGEISEPVQTQFGWHIIKLNDTRMAEAPKLEDVHDELAQEVQQQAVADRVKAITDEAKITRDADGIDPAVLKDAAILGE